MGGKELKLGWSNVCPTPQLSHLHIRRLTFKLLASTWTPWLSKVTSDHRRLLSSGENDLFLYSYIEINISSKSIKSGIINNKKDRPLLPQICPSEGPSHIGLQIKTSQSGGRCNWHKNATWGKKGFIFSAGEYCLLSPFTFHSVNMLCRKDAYKDRTTMSAPY